MVLPAVLRDPACLYCRSLGCSDCVFRDRWHHRRQVLWCSGDVRCDRGDGTGALAGHILGSFGPLSSHVQVVVRAAGDRLLRADVAGCHACGRALCQLLADRFGLLVRILPGDPARMMMDQNEDAEQLKIIQKKYGFDQPILNQYLYYLNDLSILSIHSKNPDKLNFLNKKKYSYKTLLSFEQSSIVIKFPYLRESYQRRGVKVSTIIKDTFPNTVVLAISSILIATIFGLIFGIISALNKGTFLDNFIQLLSTFGMSMPSFLSSIIFAWIFGFVLSEYTNLNMTGSLYELDDFGDEYTLVLKNLILPSIVLGIRPIAVISMMMRNSLIETLKKNYVITAYAKGLSKSKVIVNHCIKNSLNPVITALSGWFASLLAGSVFVEYIFGWNGLGREIVNSLNVLDVPVIIGSVLVISFAFIMINIFVDYIYKYLDPRIT